MGSDLKANLIERVKGLPDRPGVYVMKDSSGRVIYVGKASSLRNRVRSYFQSSAGLSKRIQVLIDRIADFEYIVTDSEVEALILENNLIKKHRPGFNVRLRDDKTYPFIKITLAEDFPRVIVTRRVEPDGSRYFGPYTDVGAMRETLRFLRRLFAIRSCSREISETKPRKMRPCLNYHIKQCLSPCSGRISKEAYMQLVNRIILFLEGHQDEVVRSLKEEMQAASDALDFERAASIRDAVRAIERVAERQKVVLASSSDIDVIGYFRDEGDACALVFFVRSGKLMGRERFFISDTAEVSDSEILTAFIKQYYSEASFIPDEVLLPMKPHDEEAISMWLREKKGRKVSIRVPKRGDKKQLVSMATDNARLSLEEEKLKAMQDAMVKDAALLELKEVLELPRLPRRIEAFDISTIQGSHAVGGMVVFESGRPVKSAYRRFKIKTVDGQDDYGMMHEIISRRYRRIVEQGGTRNQVPDLIIIDGGRGQLNAGLRALAQVGAEDIPTISLAESHELIFVDGRDEPIALPEDSKALLLLRRIRDEAHRFAVSYHRQLRTKRSMLSELEEIPGIGKKRLKALLTAFGSLKGVRAASVDEIAKVPGMNYKLAEKLKKALTDHANDNPSNAMPSNNLSSTS
ncbi:MAG: excinuclease ABC subunit UvrC [Bacillota bacterium]|jgi:excinuclease ABC subunit C|nr:excinuclease ABC subunit UvrC [Bacillota bacterium]MDI9415275.1 excinuclease ABC subunit UvrC [Bacillota bacterium]NLD12543.1 excinuclease ABC subunit UvrC [Bacillota bacterium]HOB87955.1 excinuclease ABC subunit UvrC [Bacillota bacterium]HOJ56965.1 excinuclease ABC subunit UvrC [Bacillota bacterium]